MKRLTAGLIALLVVVISTCPVLASVLTDANYMGVITITNTSTIATNVFVPFTLDTDVLIDNNYIDNDCLNTAIQINGADVAYMPAPSGTTDWSLYVSSAPNGTMSALLYTGGGDMSSKIRYFPGAAGMTVPNTLTLGAGNDFEIETAGWVDTTADGENIVYKQDAFSTYIDGATNVTAEITTVPIIESVAGGNDPVNQVNHVVTLPAGIVANDLILAIFACDDNQVITFPNEGVDWIQLFETGDAADDLEFGAWYRIADGTEGANITVTTANNQMCAWTLWCISRYQGVPEVGAATTNTNVNPDPPNLAPSWGAETTLWLAVTGYDLNKTVTVYPTDYTDGRNDIADEGTHGCGVGSASRILVAAAENPGTFTISGAEQWIANTIAIQPATDSTVTATGISSGELVVKTTADGANLTLSVTNYGGAHQGNSPQSVALDGASVPANANGWTFFENDVMPYVEYATIDVTGAPVSAWEWENDDTTFHDSVGANDGTPSFRNASSDADVSAEFTDYQPRSLAESTAYGVGGGTIFISDVPPVIPNMYDEGETGGLIIDEPINEAAAVADVPEAFIWYPIAFAVAIALGFAAFGVTRQIIVQAVVSAVVMAGFSIGGVLGDGLLPFWTVLLFVVEAVMIVLIQEKVHV